MNRYTATARAFAEKAKAHRGVALYFSGGKDSLALLDMCSRAFEQVTLVHFEFVPGVPLVERMLSQAAERWHIHSVLRLPNAVSAAQFAAGRYCFRHAAAGQLNVPKFEEFAPLVRSATGCDIVVTGAKKNDNLGFRIGVKDPHKVVWRPLWNWLNADVLAYLALHKIPRPPTPGGKSVSLIDTSTRVICWLYDNFRDSYEHLRTYFPFISAVIARRALYGVGEWVDVQGRDKPRLAGVTQPI